ncbi:acyl-coenzyme A thioesterase 13-like [Pistacia vera]|uniref:acyl-coenzyme A thioesterase 13-like n=1 Tax=Pistacia vera TaxID=55513 RepID=UPI0012638503|nr:acyl-coenzyme A thioesterase 13-like [Pistacia vera]
MAEPSTTSTTVVSEESDPEHVKYITDFFNSVGVSSTIPENHSTTDFYSNIVGGHLKVHQIQRGHITCHLTVKPAVANFYGGIHGGAVAALSERMAIGCARTVVGEDKEIFLGELSISYLSAAPKNAELIIDGFVVRSGRNLTVVAIEFKFKNSGKLACTSRATFYNTPISKL